jgi:hypothetical protein
MDYLSNDNKGLLWGILQESNIFNGIRNEKFDEIKSIFDNTINKINTANPEKNIMEKNKMTIEELINRINNVKKPNEPKIKVIYTAEDLHRDRVTELNNKMKKYENDIGSIGKINKPAEINFSDNTWNDDDKPIGDEMDRLISERLASRERELEIPAITSDAENWITNGRDNLEKKKVSFVKNDTIEKAIDSNNNNSPTAGVSILKNTPNIVDNIFNILKRKTMEVDNHKAKNVNNDDHGTSATSNSYNIVNANSDSNNDEKYKTKEYNNLKAELADIREKQDRLIKICSDMFEYVKLSQEKSK